MRPTKFLFVVAIERSPAAKIPICPPKQGPHVGVETAQPDLMNISIKPSSIACKYVACVAGKIMQRTSLWTFFPFKTFAAILKSLMRPLVHEPITDWSILTFLTWLTGFAFDGKGGKDTIGSSFETSYFFTSQYCASLSLLYIFHFFFDFLAVSFTYFNVVSSAAIMPFFPPASIAMLHIANLSSIGKRSMASPVNSIALYKAPPTQISPIV